MKNLILATILIGMLTIPAKDLSVTTNILPQATNQLSGQNYYIAEPKNSMTVDNKMQLQPSRNYDPGIFVDIQPHIDNFIVP